MGQLAELLAMDRATLGHNLRQLERDGLPEIIPSKEDRRARVATITTAGLHRIKRGRPSGITRTAPLSALSAPRKRPRCAGFPITPQRGRLRSTVAEAQKLAASGSPR